MCAETTGPGDTLVSGTATRLGNGMLGGSLGRELCPGSAEGLSRRQLSFLLHMEVHGDDEDHARG